MTRGWGGGEKASVAAEWGWGDEGTDEAGQTLQQGGGGKGGMSGGKGQELQLVKFPYWCQVPWVSWWQKGPGE